LPKAIPTWAVAVAAAVVLILVASGFVYLRWFAGNSSFASQQQAQPPQFPRMTLQGQFAGPLEGTVIQRWRDPVDGTICYIYMPMVVQHTPAPSGYVQYGSNAIGSISCMTKGVPAG
jgi:hypothetical protein